MSLLPLLLLLTAGSSDELLWRACHTNEFSMAIPAGWRGEIAPPRGDRRVYLHGDRILFPEKDETGHFVGVHLEVKRLGTTSGSAMELGDEMLEQFRTSTSGQFLEGKVEPTVLADGTDAAIVTVYVCQEEHQRRVFWLRLIAVGPNSTKWVVSFVITYGAESDLLRRNLLVLDRLRELLNSFCFDRDHFSGQAVYDAYTPAGPWLEKIDGLTEEGLYQVAVKQRLEWFRRQHSLTVDNRTASQAALRRLHGFDPQAIRTFAAADAHIDFKPYWLTGESPAQQTAYTIQALASLEPQDAWRQRDYLERAEAKLKEIEQIYLNANKPGCLNPWSRAEAEGLAAVHSRWPELLIPFVRELSRLSGTEYKPSSNDLYAELLLAYADRKGWNVYRSPDTQSWRADGGAARIAEELNRLSYSPQPSSLHDAQSD